MARKELPEHGTGETDGTSNTKKAKALLTAGDTVYFIRNGAVQSRTVKAIHKDCLDVGDDLFFFDEVAKLWFLTEKGAREKMKRRNDYGKT